MVHGWLLPNHNVRHHWLQVVQNDNRYHCKYPQKQFYMSLRQTYKTHRLNSSLRDDRNNDEDNATSMPFDKHTKQQQHTSIHRRQFLLYSTSVYTSIIVQTSNIKAAHARGLVHFPCVTPLANTYNLMRVGCTLLEEDGTNKTKNKIRSNYETFKSILIMRFLCGFDCIFTV
jgi:hypothetical protein